MVDLIKPFILILGAISVLSLSLYALYVGFGNTLIFFNIIKKPPYDLETSDKIALIMITGFILFLFSLDLLIKTFKEKTAG